MKTLDITIALLLVIGGLNWGLVGTFNFDLVATLLGPSTMFARAVYIVVGLSALYQAMQWRAIQRRWSMAPVSA